MLTLALLISPAAAQEGGFDAHGFRLATADADVRDPLTFVRPGAQSTLDFYVGGAFEYATRPLVFEPDPAADRVVALSNLVAANLATGLVVYDPLRLDVSMPVFLSSTGVDGAQAAGVGDVRLGAAAMTVQPDDAGGFGLGLVAAINLPVGDPASYLGAGGVGGTAGVTGTVESDAITLSWRVGGQFTPSTSPEERPAPTRGGPAVQGALALGWLPAEGVGITAEAHGSLPVDPAVRTAIGVPAEAVLSARYATEAGGFVTGGLGVGLGAGAGASPLRLVVGGGFGAMGGPPPDTDGDGLADRDDQCPEQAETANGFQDDNGCPDGLPEVEAYATVEGEESADAVVVIKRGDDTVDEGTGRLVVQGTPGDLYTVVAHLGDCTMGEEDARVPTDGRVTVEVPLARAEGTVVVTVADGAGRPLEGSSVRYLTADVACEAASRSVQGGKGVHTLGIGPHTVLITAPGYDIHQKDISLETGARLMIDAVLAPTQVRVDGTSITLATPVIFAEGESAIPDGAASVLGQIASTIIVQGLGKVEVHGHPDARGRGGRSLGMARAEAVVSHLATLGVPLSVLEAVGEGSGVKGSHIVLTVGAVD